MKEIFENRIADLENAIDSLMENGWTTSSKSRESVRFMKKTLDLNRELFLMLGGNRLNDIFVKAIFKKLQ